MKKIFFISLLFCGFIAQSQTSFKAWEAKINKDNCTAESVLKEPGRFWDAHIGGVTGGGKEGISSTEIANAQKMMQAFENLIKPKLQFTGGLAKASFGLNSKAYYNQFSTCSYTYNLGFHAFVCNVQTHKLAIVDEYQGVLRVNGNPLFQTVFNSYAGNAAAYKIPANTQSVNAPSISIFNYCGFADSRVVNAINNGKGFIDLNSEVVGGLSEYPVVENKPGKGYGITFPNSGFVTVNNDFVYRHAFITHTDIPFLIPITRKKFLQDMLEYYDREKMGIVPQLEEKVKNKIAYAELNLKEFNEVNARKKTTAQNLLSNKDEKWLNQQAVIPGDNKAFVVPVDRNRYLGDVYGNFYFTEFYTGTEGFSLYQVNPEYLKKYPPNGTKPAVIDVMYRFKPNYNFLMGVKESFIDQLNLDEFRKLLQ
nr:hypothetical protein [uncultured Pedobacter sp.]